MPRCGGVLLGPRLKTPCAVSLACAVQEEAEWFTFSWSRAGCLCGGQYARACIASPLRLQPTPQDGNGRVKAQGFRAANPVRASYSAPRLLTEMSRVCCGQTCKQVSAGPPHRLSAAEGDHRVGPCRVAGLGLQAMGCTSIT